MQRLLCVLSLICVLGYSGSTSDSVVSKYRRPNLGIYLAEGGASFVLGNVAGIGIPIFLAVSFPLRVYAAEDYVLSFFAYLLAYPVIYPFPSALAIDVTAKIFKCPGSFWGAVGGGFLGAGLGIGSYILLADESTGWSLMAILSPLCATTGYNVFRKKNLSHSDSLFDDNININLPGQFYHGEKNSLANPKVSIKIVEIKF